MEEDTSMLAYHVGIGDVVSPTPQSRHIQSEGPQNVAANLNTVGHSASRLPPIIAANSSMTHATSHGGFDSLEPVSHVSSTRTLPVLPSPLSWMPPGTTNSFPSISFPSYSSSRITQYGQMDKTKDDSRAFEHSPSFIPGVMPTIGLPQPLNYSPKPITSQISPSIIPSAPISQLNPSDTYGQVQDLRKESRPEQDQLSQILNESRPANEKERQHDSAPPMEFSPETRMAVGYPTDQQATIEFSSGIRPSNDFSAKNETLNEFSTAAPTSSEDPLENSKSSEVPLESAMTVEQHTTSPEQVEQVEGNSVQETDISVEGNIEAEKQGSNNSDEPVKQNENQTEQRELVLEKPQEPIEEKPPELEEEDTSDQQEMVGKLLMDVAAKVFNGSVDAALVSIRGNITFSVSTSAKNKGKTASLRINKRIPFGDLTNSATANFGVSLSVHNPPVVVRIDKTKASSRSPGTDPAPPTIEHATVPISGDNPYTRKRGRPRGEGRVKKVFTTETSPPPAKAPRTKPPKKNIKYEMENLRDEGTSTPDVVFKFICTHCGFATSSDAVYNNHMKKCEELRETGNGDDSVPQDESFEEDGDGGEKTEMPLVKTEYDVEYIEDDIESEPDAAEVDNSDDDYMPDDEDDLPLKPKGRRSARKSARPRTIRSSTLRSSDTTTGEGWSRHGKIFNCNYCIYTTDHTRHIQEHVNTHTGVKPHKCNECDKAFNKPVDLKRHKVTQHRDFRCSECDEQFEGKREMTIHYRLVHKRSAKEVYKICKICKKQCLSKEDLAQHIQENHEHICSICGEVFRNVTKLRRHRNEAHANEAIMCNICNKTFQTQTGYQRHVATHTTERIPCEVCGKSFSTKTSLSHHKRALHAGVKKYKCEKCGKEFNFYHSLKLHLLQHEGSRPYKCEICGKSYLTANHLKNHKEGVHATEKKYKCPVCNKAFPYDNSLKLHMILHTGDRPYQCEICGKGFVSKGALKSHLATHDEGRNYVCKECGKSFKAENLLRAHWRRHTDDGSRFMCDICGLTFMYKSNLDQHSAVHGDERKYSCNQCDKTFKTMATLYSHRLVHTETTPFNCSVCGKGFKSKDRVLAHERRHSGLKPYQCALCGNCFPDKGGLSKHMKTVHSKTKRYMCPVCGKQSNRMDNLRVHMKTHGDKALAPVFLDQDGPQSVHTPEPQLIPQPRERQQQPQQQQQQQPQGPEQGMHSAENSQHAHPHAPLAAIEMTRPVSASPHINQHTPTPPSLPMSSMSHVSHPSSAMMSDIRMAVEMAQQQHGHPMTSGIPGLQSHINSAMSMIPGALGLTEVANLQPAVPMQYNVPHSQGQGGMSSTVDTSSLHMAAAHAQLQPHLHHSEWKPTWQ